MTDNQIMHPALLHLDHRPWPLPPWPWRWRQSWHDLLFAHWPIPAAALRSLVPASLTVQEFAGTSWIGLVPFRMTGVMRRPLPDLPWVSAFPELNVRIYVERDGKPGVWFLSLDAGNPLAVWAARCLFYLPYFWAQMSCVAHGDVFNYSSRRVGAEFSGTYRPTSEVRPAVPGSLEHWLTERYCLYASARCPYSGSGGFIRANPCYPWLKISETPLRFLPHSSVQIQTPSPL